MPMAQAGKSLRGSGEARRMVAAQVPARQRVGEHRQQHEGRALRRPSGLTERERPGAGEAAGEGGQRRWQQRRPGQLTRRENCQVAQAVPQMPEPLLVPSSVAGAAPGTCRTARARGSARRRRRSHRRSRRTATPVRRGPVRSWRKGRRVLARRSFRLCIGHLRDLLLRHLRVRGAPCCVSSVPAQSAPGAAAQWANWGAVRQQQDLP